MNRSFLFVPADSERKLKRAAESGADALILDLEDSVAPQARPDARQLAREFLVGRENAWVRINALASEDAVADLEAVMPSEPRGIMLPKARSADDVQQLGELLSDLESGNGTQHGSTEILPLCTECPEALFTLGSYVSGMPRLHGLSWGAEDLGAALGATDRRDENGDWLPPYQLARSLCLFAAAAAEVAAIDTVYTDFRDRDGLARFVANARRDGFSGMLAIHPGQVETINRTFVPSAAELERAERIVALFDQNPGAGTLGMDGQMIDRPHLIQAQRLLRLARRLAGASNRLRVFNHE
jgi:citrate lyase subunit beta/citryl-CoA lyase